MLPLGTEDLKGTHPWHEEGWLQHDHLSIGADIDCHGLSGVTARCPQAAVGGGGGLGAVAATDGPGLPADAHVQHAHDRMQRVC